MLDNQKLPLLWDLDSEKLVAAVKEITLAASVWSEIYQGGLVEGQIRVYFGYRLENGMVVFTGEQVIELRIEAINSDRSLLFSILRAITDFGSFQIKLWPSCHASLLRVFVGVLWF